MDMYTVSTLLILVGLLPLSEGHGYMASPPGRSYASKHFDAPQYFPVNYNYRQNFCGGFGTQYNKINNGACGICGDSHQLPRPRPHERGGKYSTGNIVAQYASGDVIDVSVVITANHKGVFYFDICPTESPKTWEQEWCFQPLSVYDPSSGTLQPSYYIPKSQPGTFTVKLHIPEWLTCSYCVLRWRYKTGNNWGCEDNDPTRCCTGCGSKQEHFYSCADIMITSTGNEVIPAWIKVDKSGTIRPQLTTPRQPVPTTRQPFRTTRRTTTTTIKPYAPVTPESYMCSQFCAGVCKPRFYQLCLPRLCGKCRVYQELAYLFKARG